MIITKDIVFLNLPKTGSTFVRKTIKELYNKRIENNILLRIGLRLKLLKHPYRELILPNLLLKKGLTEYSDQHGHYTQIPKQDRKKLIVTVVRNPIDRLFSLYEFRFWADNPELEISLIKKHLPNFPNLNIDEFIDYLIMVAENSIFENKKDLNIGLMSLQFIKFFFKDPDSVLEKMDTCYIRSNKAFLNDIAPIHFLQQENLNKNLSAFLLKNKFTHREVDFVLKSKKINVTNKVIDDRSKLLTKKVVEYIENYEFFYVNVLKNYGIDYNIDSQETLKISDN